MCAVLLPCREQKEADLIIIFGIKQVDKSLSLQARRTAIETFTHTTHNLCEKTPCNCGHSQIIYKIQDFHSNVYATKVSVKAKNNTFLPTRRYPWPCICLRLS